MLVYVPQTQKVKFVRLGRTQFVHQSWNIAKKSMIQGQKILKNPWEIL